jgi:GTP-binding protein
VLTKADKLSKTKLAKQHVAVARSLALESNDLILFSAKSRKGREDVWKAIELIVN